MTILTYVPSKVEASVLGIEITGWASETFLSIEPETPTYSFRKALDGSTMATKSPFQSYKIRFTLQQSSPSNSWLYLLLNIFKQYDLPFVMPILIRDKSGSTSFFASDCWFEREPSSDFSGTLGNTTWDLYCASGNYTKGGNGNDSRAEQIVSAISTALTVAGYIGIDLGMFATALTDALED